MKTIKFRIEPNSQQRKVIDQMIDANRLIYNNMLTACKIEYERKKELPSTYGLYRLITRMRHNSTYVARVYSLTIQQTINRVIKACEKTLGVREKQHGEFNINTGSFLLPNYHYPRYKSYNQFSSIMYPSTRDYSIITEKKGRKQKRKLRLGKVPGLIRCYNQSTPINGDMKTCVVKRKDMGHFCLYYACISYEPSPVPMVEPIKGPVGVDMGIYNIVALSDGKVFPNNYISKTMKEKMAKQQRKLNKTSPGTLAYKKTQTRVNHLYKKIENHRKNNTEVISSYLVKNYSHIVMERLSVKQLRSISMSRFMTNGYNDASLGMLRKRIKDKASSAGREIILVDPRETSQMCSVCEGIVDKDLFVRQHICPYCGYTADRDVNAARNILNRSQLVQTLWVDQPPLSLSIRAE